MGGDAGDSPRPGVRERIPDISRNRGAGPPLLRFVARRRFGSVGETGGQVVQRCQVSPAGSSGPPLVLST